MLTAASRSRLPGSSSSSLGTEHNLVSCSAKMGDINPSTSHAFPSEVSVCGAVWLSCCSLVRGCCCRLVRTWFGAAAAAAAAWFGAAVAVAEPEPSANVDITFSRAKKVEKLR